MEVPTCDTGFLHEKWPPFWGSSKLIFFENVSCNRPSWYKTYQLSGSHSFEALSPKKLICAQTTKIVVAARHSVKSQVHFGKQPTKNQGKNRSAEDLALPNSKKRCKGHDIEKKTAKSRPPVWVLWMRRPLNLRISFSKKNLKEYLAKKMSGTRQQLEDLTTVGSQKMVSSAAKRKIKAKGDKMLTLERYFESCGRDLSRSLS